MPARTKPGPVQDQELIAALLELNWDHVYELGDGRKFAFLWNDEPVAGVKVFGTNRDDSFNDRTVEVVVEFNGKYFKRTGYANTGSHCYEDEWDGKVSWNRDLIRVTPKTKTVTVYE